MTIPEHVLLDEAIRAMWDVYDAFHHRCTPPEERIDEDKRQQLPLMMQAVCLKLRALPPGQLPGVLIAPYLQREKEEPGPRSFFPPPEKTT